MGQIVSSPAHPLSLSPDLSLPLNFVTERIAFLARTGAGKSGGMRVLFEAFLELRQFGVFIDPKGDAWGIRAAGTGAGYPVLVLGGDHGDVPLQAGAGKVIAEFLAKERVSTVLDISDFGKADMVRFVTDLASTLYRINRDVVHIFLDEADMVAGEKFYDPRCMEAIQLIQNKGRGRGFGVTVATQRSAMLNKSVLFASGTLIAMQTTGPRDIKAVREWLEVAGTPEATQEIIKALPTLKTREAFVYSPQFLGPSPRRITFKSFRTFDSMRTPQPGEARQQPKRLADIDLGAIQRDMAQTIEEAKAKDPVALQARIRTLEQELAKKPAPAAVKQERVEVPVFTEKELKILEKLGHHLTGCERVTQNAANRLQEIRDAAAARLAKVPPVAPPPHPLALRRRESYPVTPPRAAQPVDGDLGKCARVLLTVLVQFHPKGCTRNRLALVSGYSVTSSTFSNGLSELRVRTLMFNAGEALHPSPGGVELIGDNYERLPEGDEAVRHWINKLEKCPSALLSAVHLAGGRMTKQELSDATQYSVTSSTFSNGLSTLRVMGLIQSDADNVWLAPEFSP